MVQVLDANGNSLSGDMKSIKELNSISSDGNVKPYSSTQYQIRWKWDFENGTDDYDTFLGNKAVDEEIACHINISVISEYDYDESSVESDSSDTPSDSSTIKTSDNRSFALYIVISIFSAITIALIIIFRKNTMEISKMMKKILKYTAKLFGFLIASIMIGYCVL